MTRFDEIVNNLHNNSVPSYGLTPSKLRAIVNANMVENRISSEDGTYGFSEAIYPDIEAWEVENAYGGYDFEMLVREDMADAT